MKRRYFILFAMLALGFLAAVPGKAQPASGFAQPLGVISCQATAVPPVVRAEGLSELVGNIVLSCVNIPPALGGSMTSYVTANISDSLNVNITNNRDFNGANVTDSVLVINDNHCNSPATTGSTFGSCGAPDLEIQDPQFGLLAANNRLEWNAVSIPVPGGLRPGADPSEPCSTPGTCFPSVTTVRIASVRANASQLGVPGAASFPATQVTSFLSITGETLLSVTNNVLNVAVPILGLIVEDSDAIAGLQCVDMIDIATITLSEGFATAFKTIGVPVSTPGTTQWESGYWAPGSNNGGGASQGTRFMLRFFNIPEGVVLLIPNAIETGNPGVSGDALSIVLVANTDANGAGGNLTTDAFGATEVTLSGGFGVAVYEVIDSNPIANEEVPLFIGVGWESDTANDLPAIGTGQVSVSFAPLSTVNTSSGPAPEPRFIDTNEDPDNIVSIVRCSTTLLFPFVTNQSSFDTGMVISNTSDDWQLMGTEAQDGACTIHYIGETTGGGASPPDQTSAVIEAGEQLLWTLSSGNAAGGIAGAPEFQGYVIAVCEFQYAHGFAFITNGFGGIPTLAQGYLALVIPVVTRASPPLIGLSPVNVCTTTDVDVPCPPQFPVTTGRVPGEILDAEGHSHPFGEALQQ